MVKKCLDTLLLFLKWTVVIKKVNGRLLDQNKKYLSLTRFWLKIRDWLIARQPYQATSMLT